MEYKDKENLILKTFSLTKENVASKSDFIKGKITDSDMFCWISMETCFFNGFLAYEDFKDINVDGDKDGGIDAILDSNIIIQSKDIKAKSEEVIGCFSRAKKVCDNLKNNIHSNPNGKGNLDLNLIEKFNDKINKEEKIDIYVFVREKFETFDIDLLEKWINDNNDSDYNYHYRTRKEIINLFKEISDNDSVLNEFRFKNHNNLLINSNNNLKNLEGIIINSSLYELYEMFDDNKNTLFLQNVREFIKGLNNNTNSGNVNSAILKTLEKYPDLLWFANNGIVILAESLKINFKEIIINNFSVINGAQTVTNIFNFISSIDKENKINYLNIPIVCKIIERPKNSDNKDLLKFDDLSFLQEDFQKFIIRSTNNQKPILSWTFFFDEDDVKMVKNLLEKRQIYLKIKDGSINKEILEKYSKDKIITLPDFAQISKSTLNLTPGKAMQRKTKLFLEDREYKYTFKIIEKRNDFVIIPIKAFNLLSDIKSKDCFKEKNKIINKGKQWIMAYFSIKMLEDQTYNIFLEKLKLGIKSTNLSEINFIWSEKKKINLEDSLLKKELDLLINEINDKDLPSLYKDDEFLETVRKILIKN